MDYVEFLYDLLLLCAYAIIIAILLSIAIAILRVQFASAFQELFSQFHQSSSRSFKASYRRLDLTHLEKLLSEGRWLEADRETNRLMLWAAYSENARTLTHVKVLNFPEETLLAVDTLWAKHSNGRFGFDIKRHIYLELGMSASKPYRENEVIIEKFLTFADYIGWRVEGRYLDYEELTFDITAPAGHLPACKWLFPTAIQRPSDEHRVFYKAMALLLLVKRW